MEDINKSKDSFFTVEKESDLKLYKDIKNRMIKDMVAEGLTDSRSRRLMNEILTSAEASIHKNAELRLKHSDNKSKEAIVAQMAEVLKNTHKKRLEAFANKEEVNPDIDNKYIPTDIVKGETEIDPAPLNIEDFISGEQE